MLIRKATLKDLRSIVDIFRVESAKPPYNKKRTLKDALKGIKNDFKGNNIHVAIIDDEIIGFIMMAIDSGIKTQAWINELWILEEYQGRGIGRKFMAEIEKIYKNKGISIFKLAADTRKGGARDFYKKLNYDVDKSMVFMEKKLK